MPVELRKRAAPAAVAPPPAKKSASTKKAPTAAAAAKPDAPKKADSSSTSTAKKTTAAAKPASAPAKPPAAAASSTGPPAVGDHISLEGFGGEVETHEGEKTTLAALVAASEAGVVLFTYPAASTPGCTKQVCFFRDAYAPLTAGGLAIYGLSKDSPKANTTFVTKQKLPYRLLCDPKLTLISAIGLKKAPSGTTRGVFVVSKAGEVLVAEPGSPEGTFKVVEKLVARLKEGKVEEEDEAKEVAETAAEVADSAEKIDEE